MKRLVCGVYIVGPTLRRLNLDDINSSDHLFASFDPPVPRTKVLSSAAASETPSHAGSVGQGSETRPVDDEAPQTMPTDASGAPSSATKSHQRTSVVSSSTKVLQEPRPCSAGEIRFCFTEHRGHLESPSTIGKISPRRAGLIRSLPADPADMDVSNRNFHTVIKSE